MSDIRSNPDWPEFLRRFHALHEAGHVVVLLAAGGRLYSVTLAENGIGHTDLFPFPADRQGAFLTLVVLVAGHVAEHIGHPDAPGLLPSEKLPGADPETDVWRAHDLAKRLAGEGGDALAVIRQAEEVAEEALTASWVAVEAIQGLLVERGTLTEAEVLEIVAPPE